MVSCLLLLTTMKPLIVFLLMKSKRKLKPKASTGFFIIRIASMS